MLVFIYAMLSPCHNSEAKLASQGLKVCSFYICQHKS